jgi:glycosyltransferase involved in cell wall biosynthesis
LTNIAFLSGNRLGTGGVETYILSLVGLSNDGLYRWNLVGDVTDDFAQKAARYRISLHKWQTGFPIDRKAIRSLREYLFDQSIDLIHAQDLRSSIAGGLAARTLNIPVVRTIHMPEFYTSGHETMRSRLRRSYYYWLERIVNRWLIHRIIFVSGRIRDQAVQLNLAPIERSEVIQNGIVLPHQKSGKTRSEIRQSLHTLEDAFVLIYVGRLEFQKGVDILLHALSNLTTEIAYEVWIIGDGSLRSELESLSTELRLNTRIRFLGQREDVPDLLAASDVFVMPSRYEGMSIALLEAMGSGLPCIVTDVGENGVIVRGANCGYVIPPGEVDRLSIKLRELMSAAELRMEMSAAARLASEGYSDAEMAARTYAVYNSLLTFCGVG